MSQQSHFSYDDRFAVAIDAQRSGNMAVAEEAYRQLIDQAPSRPEAWHMYGVLSLQTGRLEQSIQLIGKATEIDPDFGYFHYDHGNAYFAAEQFEPAIDAYNQAIRCDPTLNGVLVNLGNAYFGAGRLYEALTTYRSALAINPEAADVRYNMCIVLERIGIHDEALATVEHFVQQSPDDAEGHYFKGVILEGIGRIGDAIDSFDKALTLNPEHVEAWYNLHGCLYGTEAGRRRALQCLEQVLHLDPSHSKGRFFLGVLSEVAGNRQTATQLFESLSSSDEETINLIDAWRYIEDQKDAALFHLGTSVEMLEHGIQVAALDGLVLEFGVRHGTSIRQIAAATNQAVHGFDSFEGLPEDWHGRPKESYTTLGNLPEVPINVSLHVGLFGKTLPGFLAAHAGPIRFMNIDCDLYSSTQSIFDLVADRIVPGTVIAFDEYIGNPHWREDEFKAFQEAVSQHGWKYRYLGFSLLTQQALVLIISRS